VERTMSQWSYSHGNWDHAVICSYNNGEVVAWISRT